jgi:hypothetical protein
MTRSSFSPSPATATDRATGYTDGGQAVPPSSFTEQAPSGLSSSAADVARFVAAGMTGPSGERPGRGVLTPAGVSALLAPGAVPDGSATSLGYDVQTLPDGTDAAGHTGKNTGWLTEFITLPDRGEGLVVLTNSDSSGPVGMTTRAWAGSLGVGAPMTAQMVEAELAPQFTAMLALTVLLGLVALGWAAVLLRPHPTGTRRWVWRAGHHLGPAGWTIRAVVSLTALAAVGAWWTAPLRLAYASISATPTAAVTAALLTVCGTALLAAATRTLPRATAPATDVPARSLVTAGRAA